ncbi:MAG: DedA family protein [Hyphomicrobiaceae bacterium]
MSFEAIKATVLDVVTGHMVLAEPAVMAMGFIEGIPVLSLFVPSSVLFLGIGTAHAAAGGNFWQLWLFAATGAMASDVLMYALGRIYKSHTLRIWPLSRHPDWWHKGHDVLVRWGAVAVLGGKFMGPFRPAIPTVSGVLMMPLWKFLPASLASSLIWAGTLLGPGYGLKWLAD